MVIRTETVSALAERVARLEKRRLLAGNGIRLTGLPEESVIEAEADADKLAALEDRIAELEDRTAGAGRLRLCAGPGIVLEHNGTECRVSCRPTEPPDSAGRKSGRTDVPVLYPFQVLRAEPVAGYAFGVEIAGYQPARGRRLHSMVYGGLSAAAEYVPDRVFSFAESSWLWLNIRFIGVNTDTLNVTASCGTEPDAQSAECYVVPLAYLDVSAGVLTIHQLHFGNVEITGRVI